MRNTRQRSKWRGPVFWLLALGVLRCGICIWVLATLPETQVGISAKCVLVPGSAKMNILSYGYNKLSPYQWMPDGSLLQIDENPGTGVNAALPVQITDAKSGATKSLATVPIKRDVYVDGPGPYLAPDGKHIIHEGFAKLFLVALNGSKTVVPIPIDGPNKMNQPCRIRSRVAWTPDSLHWLEISEHKHYIRLLIHDVKGRVERIIPVKGPVEYSSLIGITNRNHALVQVFEGKNLRAGSLLDVDLSGSVTISPVKTVSLPGIEKAETDTIVLSPGGDRLAWMTKGNPRAKIRSFSVFLRPETYDFTFWTAQLDAGDTQLQETMRLKANQQPYDLGWTPDGKQISFAHNRTLYTLPVR